MTKISLLPLLGSEQIDGSETAPVIKGGVNYRASLLSLIWALAKPSIDQAAASAGNAASYAAVAESWVSYAAKAEHERAIALYRAFAHTTSAQAVSIVSTGDSTNFGVGQNQTISQVMGMLMPTCTFVKTGVAGRTSPQILAIVNGTTVIDVPETATQRGNHHLGCTIGTNNVNDAVAATGVWGNMPALLADMKAIRDCLTGGAKFINVMLAEIQGCGPGEQLGADFAWLNRQGRRAVADGGLGAYWLDSRILAFVGAARSGPDRYVTEVLGKSLPPSMRGDGTNGAVQVVPNGAPIQTFTVAPTDLTPFEEGQVIFVGANGTSGDFSRKLTLAGVAAWRALDVKHINEFYLIHPARKMKQMLEVINNVAGAPPVMAEWSFRCAQDVAAGTVVATIPILTSVSSMVGKIEIVAGDPHGCWAVSNSGKVTRTNSGTLVRQNRPVHLLARVSSTGINPVHSYSWIVAYVGRPSIDTVPRPITITLPGIALVGRASGTGLAVSRKASFAFKVKPSNIAAQQYFINFAPVTTSSGGTSGRFQVRINAGRPEIYITNAAGTQIARCYPKSSGSGGYVMANGVADTIFGSIDLDAGTVQLYHGDTVFDFSINGSLVMTAADIDWPRMAPGALALNGPSLNPNVAVSGASQFLGDFWGAAVWPGTFIDWSVQANRRVHMNADGSCPAGAFRSATAGVVPYAGGWAGDICDLMWGDNDYTDAGGPGTAGWTVSGNARNLTQNYAG